MPRRHLAAAAASLPLLLAACGEDDGEGGTPDIFLGLSGLILAIIVIYLVVRWLGNNHS